MSTIKASTEPLTQYERQKLGLSNEGAHLDTIKEGLQDHVAFFVDVVESRKVGKAVVTVASTVEALRSLGCDASFTATIGLPGLGRDTNFIGNFGGHALTGIFAKRQGNGIGGVVEVDRLAEVGVRGTRDGVSADTGSFRKPDGTIDDELAARFFSETAARTPGPDGKPKRYVTLADLEGYLGDTKYPGKIVNEAELRLKFELFGQITHAGEKIITAAHWVAFLDGTSWEGLAKARDANELYVPVGEPKHESSKKIAGRLAAQTAQYGGITVDAGTKALYGAAGLIDDEASRKWQGEMKNLGSTLGGALLMLCPFKGMAAMMKPKALASTS